MSGLPSMDDWTNQIQIMDTSSQNGNTAFAQAYSKELRDVVSRYCARMPRTMQRHLGPSELGHLCLTGDTEVVTRQGIKKIRELVGEKEAELLVPMLYGDTRKSWGHFQTVPVSCYGEQEVHEVILRRNQEHKVVRTTADHNWFRWYYSGKNKKQQKLSTADLRPGYRLVPLRRAMPRRTTLMHWAVAQGFVFGDGTKGSSDDRHRPASLNLYHNGKDEAMLKFFPGEWNTYPPSGTHTQAKTLITGLPRFWKELPPIDESVSFLLSWLSGYFAADGTVGSDGQCSISSAKREHLEFVQSVAAVCGVGYGQVHSQFRTGISGNHLAPEPTELFKVSLRRKDLPLWFFHGAEHKRRVEELGDPRDSGSWIVEEVRSTGTRELVYCPTVEGAGAFALADDLMTGNCDRQVIGKMAGVSLGSSNALHDPWASFVGTQIHAGLEDAFKWDAEAPDPEKSAMENGKNPGRWEPERRVTPDPQSAASHPGTADLYDHKFKCVVDHKCQSEGVRDKLKRHGPPPHYFFQMLLYALGYIHAGFDVERIVLVSWPRTKSSMDDIYVWEHVITEQDLIDVVDLLAKTEVREELAKLVAAGELDLYDVPMTPSNESCQYCSLYQPRAAIDPSVGGCPGTAAK